MADPNRVRFESVVRLLVPGEQPEADSCCLPPRVSRSFLTHCAQAVCSKALSHQLFAFCPKRLRAARVECVGSYSDAAVEAHRRHVAVLAIEPANGLGWNRSSSRRRSMLPVVSNRFSYVGEHKASLVAGLLPSQVGHHGRRTRQATAHLIRHLFTEILWRLS